VHLLVVYVSKIFAGSYAQTTPFLQCLALHCLPITVHPVARKFGTIPHSFVNESTSDVIDETKNVQKTQFRVKGFTAHKACSLLLIFISNKHESLAAFCWGRCLCGRRESFVRGFFVPLLSPSIHSHCEAIKEATTSVMN